nr:MAG TPA: hypothetical protein [Caudoviricetes sp.]
MMFSHEQQLESGTMPPMTPSRDLRLDVIGLPEPDSIGSPDRRTLSGGVCSS